MSRSTVTTKVNVPSRIGMGTLWHLAQLNRNKLEYLLHCLHFVPQRDWSIVCSRSSCQRYIYTSFITIGNGPNKAQVECQTPNNMRLPLITHRRLHLQRINSAETVVCFRGRVKNGRTSAEVSSLQSPVVALYSQNCDSVGLATARIKTRKLKCHLSMEYSYSGHVQWFAWEATRHTHPEQ